MMQEYNLLKLINNTDILGDKIKIFMDKKILLRQSIDINEIEGHILKSESNLRFISIVIKENFLDWALTGCYYSCYHAALALILSKGYSSKSHLATLCIIIRDFYNKELNKEDIEILSQFLCYEDILFYVNTKTKRENATYSTKTLFDKKEIERLRIQAILFVNKIKEILKKD